DVEDVGLGAGVALGAEVPVDLRDAELDAGAASAVVVSRLSAAFVFFERLFFVVLLASELAEVSPVAVVLLPAEVSAPSAVLLFFDRLFFVAVVSAAL